MLCTRTAQMQHRSNVGAPNHVLTESEEVLHAELCGLGHLLGGVVGHHRRLCLELHQGGGEFCKVMPPAEPLCSKLVETTWVNMLAGISW